MSEQQLVCPNCLHLNTIHESELMQSPLCCDCEGELLPHKPIEADEKLFNQFIKHSTLPVIVDFWGPWSGISHEMVGIFSSLAKIFKGDAIFLRVNSEEHQVLANSFKLLDIPTFILFTSSVEYHRIHGVVSEREFHAWLERYLRIKRKKIAPHSSSI